MPITSKKQWHAGGRLESTTTAAWPSAVQAVQRGRSPPDGLDAWEESPYYTDRERAALAWAEAVTNIKETHAPDDVYQETRKHFNEKELADLTLAISTINAWNRLAISARSVPGLYQPARSHEQKRSA